MSTVCSCAWNQLCCFVDNTMKHAKSCSHLGQSQIKYEHLQKQERTNRISITDSVVVNV